MYDARNGKILTFGGADTFATFGTDVMGTGDTVIITIGGVGAQAQTKVVGSLHMPRVYGNGVVLPDGRVLVLGGSEIPHEFNDDTPVLNPGAPPCPRASAVP